MSGASPTPNPGATTTSTQQTASNQTPETATAATGTETKPEAVLGTQTEAALEPFDETKLTLPEGFKAEGEGWDKFKNIAKNLSHKDAQEFISLHAEALNAAMRTLTEDWQAQQTKWMDEIKADPELGGQNYETMRQTVAKVMDNPNLTSPKFREALIMTGAGNHPDVVRSLYRWAKALTEGGSVNGEVPNRDANGKTVTERPSLAAAMYGPEGPRSGGPNMRRP